MSLFNPCLIRLKLLTLFLFFSFLSIFQPITGYAQTYSSQMQNDKQSQAQSRLMLKKSKLCSDKLKHFLIQLAKQSQHEYSQLIPSIYSSEKHTIAWLKLIDIINQLDCSIENNYRQVEHISTQITEWKYVYPQHPAQYFFPSLFSVINKEKSSVIRLAVLIPFAEHFQPFSDTLLESIYLASKNKQIEINLYDTSKMSLENILQQIKHNGDKCILGPLRKEKLQEIVQYPIDIPILGLNMLSNTAIGHSYLFQMSFSDDSQADFLSQQIEQHNLNNGVLFYSLKNQADIKLAEKIANNHLSSFGKWRGIIPIDSKKNDFGHEIQKSLLLDQSFKRHKYLEAILKNELQFIPRRRQDVDFIALVISQENLHNLYSQLRYWYTEYIPVYAVLNEKELIRLTENQQEKEQQGESDFQENISLANLNLILPKWYKQHLDDYRQLDFLSNKLSFLGKSAITLIKRTQCLRLENIIFNKNIKLEWKLNIKTKTFILAE